MSTLPISCKLQIIHSLSEHAQFQYAHLFLSYSYFMFLYTIIACELTLLFILEFTVMIMTSVTIISIITNPTKFQLCVRQVTSLPQQLCEDCLHF
jgi:hypothetical protein